MFEPWTERWTRAIVAAQERGARDTRLQIGPPATRNQLLAVETALKTDIPEQFKRTLLEFSARVDFFWFLRRDDNPPPPLAGIFCGGCSWDIARLVDLQNEVDWLAQNVFIGNAPEEAVWRRKFPFHAVVNGDFIAIDQTSGSGQGVVYLSHELASSHAHRLGTDFFDFMDRWTRLGCPDDDIWPRFVPQAHSYIALKHEHATMWCKGFGLPQPHDA